MMTNIFLSRYSKICSEPMALKVMGVRDGGLKSATNIYAEPLALLICLIFEMAD